MTKQQAGGIKVGKNTLRSLAKAVRQDKLWRTVDSLASFPTRHTHSKHLPKVARWIGSQFWKRGYNKDVLMVPYQHGRYERLNVLCRKESDNAHASVRIVCAHFDSRTEDSGDRRSPAPGANDNATGIAVLLELARLLQPMKLDHTIEFLATSGEEQDLWGAKAYAEHVKGQNTKIDFVLNIDEVGCPNEAREVVLEYDTTDDNMTNNRLSEDLARRVAKRATEELNITSMHKGIIDSDYMPFEKLGYVAIGLFESGEYEFEHSSRDIPYHVDFAYVADVTRVALAALLDQEGASAKRRALSLTRQEPAAAPRRKRRQEPSRAPGAAPATAPAPGSRRRTPA